MQDIRRSRDRERVFTICVLRATSFFRSRACVRACVRQGSDTSVYLRQYKADGTVFWNHVFVAALRNSEDKIINYVGIQHPLDKVNKRSLL